MFEQLRDTFGTVAKVSLAELRQHRWLLGCLVFLSLTQVAPYVVKLVESGRGIRLYLFIAFGLTLLAIVHKYSFFLVCVLLSLGNLFYLHIDRHWGGRDLRSRVEASFESHPSEATEYLRSHVDSIDIGMSVFGLLYFGLLVYVVFLAKTRLTMVRRIAGVILVAWSLAAIGARVDRKLERFPLYDLSHKIFAARQQFQLLHGRRAFLAQRPLEPRDCESKYDKIVVVLGESAISDHMSLFGYERATTPFADRSRPHAFDALAPSNQTRHAIPMMLSGAAPGDFDRFYSEHSLISELRACGFQTTWISNQGRIGNNDSFNTSIALEADEQIFLNRWKSTETSLDGHIVSELEKRGVHRRSNHATFVHLIGSHVRYEKRYPKGFGFPDASDRITQYDNSILYTDHVLSELFEMFGEESLLFIYVSDHGQIVSSTKFGSGFLPAYKEEFRIPLLIWTADSAAVQEIRSAAGDSKINVQSLDDIIRFLTGISESPNISTTANVSVLSPERVQNYHDLTSFHAE